MRHSVLLAGAMALATLTAGAVQAQPMGPGPMQGPMASGALPTPEYVRKAAQSDEFEIAEAHLALERSHNPHIMQFAQRMITDHSKSTMMIKMAVRRSGMPVPPPPPLSPEQDQMMAALRSAPPGPAFDRMYVDQQVQAHQMALAVHQGYADGGNDPALRHAAKKIVPVVEMHLNMAQMMQSHMG